jgi:hypothetical protein
MTRNQMREYGWKYKGSCMCSIPTAKYELKTSAGLYRIKHRRDHFLIETPTKSFTRYSLEELKPILDELFAKFNKKDIQDKAEISGLQ